MGRIVDRTDTKMGKARVWLLRMCIPFAISTMLLFFVPQNFPDMVKYVYVFLIYNITNAVCLTGMLVMAIGFVGSAVFTSPMLLIASNVLKGLGVGFAGGMALGMVADTVTYGKLKTGIDTVGMGNAGISAAQKIGLGLGQAIFGWVLAAAGLDAALDAQGLPQPETVSTAIKFLYGWVPAIMAAAMFVIFLLFYHCERDIKRLEENA